MTEVSYSETFNLLFSREFLDDFLTITFTNSNTLSIAYDSMSDYTWVLEEATSKIEQERIMICCAGNKLYQNNIPPFL